MSEATKSETEGSTTAVDGNPEGKEAAVIVQGLLPVVKEAKSRLARAEIPAVIVPAPEVEGAPKDPRGKLFLLAIAPERVDDAQKLLVGQVEAPVVDFNAKEMTCPACGHSFPTGPKACPDCELFLG